MLQGNSPFCECVFLLKYCDEVKYLLTGGFSDPVSREFNYNLLPEFVIAVLLLHPQIIIVPSF